MPLNVMWFQFVSHAVVKSLYMSPVVALDLVQQLVCALIHELLRVGDLARVPDRAQVVL